MPNVNHPSSSALAALPLTTVLVMAFAAGCQRDRSVGGDFIPPERTAHAMDRALLAQAATGAAEDRVLWPVHFDGPVLNSLGEHKLTLMMQASEFVLTPEVFVASARSDHLSAVEAYLDRLGFESGDVVVRMGTNGMIGSPAVLRLAQQEAMRQGGRQPVAIAP